MSETRVDEVDGMRRLLVLVEGLMGLSETGRRIASVQQVQATLRSVRAWVDRPVSMEGSEVHSAERLRLDVDAWLVWAEAGLALFVTSSSAEAGEEESEEQRGVRCSAMPSLNAIIGEARRIAIVVAMVRSGGNLSHAAEELGTSRSALRVQLRAAGLYPWDRVLDSLGRDAGGAHTGREPRNGGGGDDGA